MVCLVKKEQIETRLSELMGLKEPDKTSQFCEFLKEQSDKDDALLLTVPLIIKCKDKKFFKILKSEKIDNEVIFPYLEHYIQTSEKEKDDRYFLIAIRMVIQLQYANSITRDRLRRYFSLEHKNPDDAAFKQSLKNLLLLNNATIMQSIMAEPFAITLIIENFQLYFSKCDTPEKRLNVISIAESAKRFDLIQELEDNDFMLCVRSENRGSRMWLRLVACAFNYKKSVIVEFSAEDIEFYLSSFNTSKKRLPVIEAIYNLNDTDLRKRLSASNHALYLKACKDPERKLEILDQLIHSENNEAEMTGVCNKDLESYLDSSLYSDIYDEALIDEILKRKNNESLVKKIKKDHLLTHLNKASLENESRLNVLCAITSAEHFDVIGDLSTDDILLCIRWTTDLLDEIKVDLLTLIFTRPSIEDDIKKLRISELKLYFPHCYEKERLLIIKTICSFISDKKMTPEERSFVVKTVINQDYTSDSQNVSNDEIFQHVDGSEAIQYFNENVQEEDWQPDCIALALQILFKKENSHKVNEEISLFIARTASTKLQQLLKSKVDLHENILIKVVGKFFEHKELKLIAELPDEKIKIYLSNIITDKELISAIDIIYSLDDHEKRKCVTAFQNKVYLEEGLNEEIKPEIFSRILQSKDQDVCNKLSDKQIQNYRDSGDASERLSRIKVIVDSKSTNLIYKMIDFYLENYKNMQFSPEYELLLTNAVIQKKDTVLIKKLPPKNIAQCIKNATTEDEKIEILDLIVNAQYLDAIDEIDEDDLVSYINLKKISDQTLTELYRKIAGCKKTRNFLKKMRKVNLKQCLLQCRNVQEKHPIICEFLSREDATKDEKTEILKELIYDFNSKIGENEKFLCIDAILASKDEWAIKQLSSNQKLFENYLRFKKNNGGYTQAVKLIIATENIELIEILFTEAVFFESKDSVPQKISFFQDALYILKVINIDDLKGWIEAIIMSKFKFLIEKMANVAKEPWTSRFYLDYYIMLLEIDEDGEKNKEKLNNTLLTLIDLESDIVTNLLFENYHDRCLKICKTDEQKKHLTKFIFDFKDFTSGIPIIFQWSKNYKTNFLNYYFSFFEEETHDNEFKEAMHIVYMIEGAHIYVSTKEQKKYTDLTAPHAEPPIDSSSVTNNNMLIANDENTEKCTNKRKNSEKSIGAFFQKKPNNGNISSDLSSCKTPKERKEAAERVFNTNNTQGVYILIKWAKDSLFDFNYYLELFDEAVYNARFVEVMNKAYEEDLRYEIYERYNLKYAKLRTNNNTCTSSSSNMSSSSNVSSSASLNQTAAMFGNFEQKKRGRGRPPKLNIVAKTKSSSSF